ncbi:glycoside hydrolase family 127 protein [Actinotalea sp. M2MS4P-6]|uniref:glycoside hydrolase family 127 protein n=1 Tax=Actinotalea sp. M2MS4P-6 TaxID=2983762 RepID=UPI0021E44AB1|nr:glycoside hydrolase family 127 protein [Actinotalea sp. M2MS4P-6]MCV2393297.1 glycoside hydrolase family 127 protein [Actinotalea sp. M2MS4P-6]
MNTAPTRATHAAVPVSPTRGRLRPLGRPEVTLTGGFWGARQAVNAAATLPHIGHWLEREGWLPNFDRVVDGTIADHRRGRQFSDSEVYKYLEALAWEIGRTGDEALDARFRAVVDRVAAAQEPDGYLNTAFGNAGQPPRWSDLEWGHELYCLGHLFQAAVARARTRPDAGDGLLDVARRAADLVCVEFGPEGNPGMCGHAEIEPALAELGRLTGEQRYVDQAALFVERHGHGVLGEIEFGPAYFQDDVPVRQATVLRGHAVRAGYLSAGAVDVATETDDQDLLEALRRQWSATVARRVYITGGVGSRHQDEAFGDDWELPPDRAYSETCAGIASIMFSWRLLLADGDPRHADLIERTLFNVVATSPSSQGTSFYYANTLHQRVPGEPADPDEPSPRARASLRAPWFGVSCCPPNVARTLASLDAYLASADQHGIQLHQYAPCTIGTRLAGDRPVGLEVQTDYPTGGTVRVLVTDTDEAPWTLTLRVPGWAPGAVLRVLGADGSAVEPDRDVQPGAVVVERAFRVGDAVELELPMAPRLVTPDPRIDAVRGCAVVERGPEVLCLESTDLVAVSGGVVDDVADVRMNGRAAPVEADGRVLVPMVRLRTSEDPWPYRADRVDGLDDELLVPLVPYHDWAERGPSTMRVFIPLADG